MGDEFVWFKSVVGKVKSDLDELCPVFGVDRFCGVVLDGFLEVDPLWFEGRRSRTIVASVLYVSVLLGRGPRRGLLKKVLDAVGVSKPSLRDAVTRFAFVDWEDEVVYLNPRLFNVLSKKIDLPEYVVPYVAKEVVRVKLKKAAPGLYEYFELQCVKEVGRDCVSLLFEDPAVFRDIVLKRYSVPVIARRIIERYLAPIVDALGLDEAPKKLAELLINNPKEFKSFLPSRKSSNRSSS